MTVTETKKQAELYREGGHRLQAAPGKRFFTTPESETGNSLTGNARYSVIELKLKVEPCTTAPLAYYAWGAFHFLGGNSNGRKQIQL